MEKMFSLDLLLSSKHHELLHAGPMLMMANLNSKYYIIGAKRLTGRLLQGLVSSQLVNCLHFTSQLEVFSTMLALTMQALPLTLSAHARESYSTRFVSQSVIQQRMSKTVALQLLKAILDYLTFNVLLFLFLFLRLFSRKSK